MLRFSFKEDYEGNFKSGSDLFGALGDLLDVDGEGLCLGTIAQEDAKSFGEDPRNPREGINFFIPEILLARSRIV